MQVLEETFPLPAAFLPQRQGKEQELLSQGPFLVASSWAALVLPPGH